MFDACLVQMCDLRKDDEGEKGWERGKVYIHDR